MLTHQCSIRHILAERFLFVFSSQGGITSSDLATKAMGARRAEVVGQALPGVPIWKLGEGSRHPGIPYIVFPGEHLYNIMLLSTLCESKNLEEYIRQYV